MPTNRITQCFGPEPMPQATGYPLSDGFVACPCLSPPAVGQNWQQYQQFVLAAYAIAAQAAAHRSFRERLFLNWN